MKNKENTKTIKQLAFERSKRVTGKVSVILALLVVTLIGCLALAIVIPGSLLITIPFLGIPAVFAFMSVNTVAEENIPTGIRSFFLLFKSYYSKHFFGTFKVIVSYLLSFLVLTALALLVSILGTTILTYTSPEFVTEFANIALIEDVVELERQLNEFFEASVEFQTISQITTFVAMGGCFLAFVHFILFNSIKCYYNLLSNAPIFGKDLNTVFSIGLKKVKKDFKKDYRSATWFLTLILILGYSLGILFAVFVTKSEPDVAIIFGYFGALVLLLPFIDYYFNSTLLLFKKYHPTFINTFIDLSIETINEFKKQQNISEEKEKEIMKFIEAQKKKTSELEDKDNDEKNHD